MSTDEKILKTLEELQAGQKALQADVASIKDVQQKQGGQIAALQDDMTAVKSGQEQLEVKVEAIHDYQKKAHTEIMGHLIESNEISGQEQKKLEKRFEKRIERIEKHLGLPPLK